MERGYAVVVLNPLIMKKFASSGIRKTKTDKVDAALLAKIGFLEPNLRLFKETPEHIEKKLLSQMIGSLKRKRRECVQRLHQLEEMRILGGASGEACVASLHTLIHAMDAEIAGLEQKLMALTSKEAGLIATIPGVGAASASRITAELGDVSRFRRRDQVTAFAGLDPSIRESGTSVRGRSRITKRGSPGLRGILGQAAWGVMMHNPVFKDYYEKKKSEGKHYLTILMAIAKKLLLLIYGMLKSGASYDLARHMEATKRASGLTSV
jgi:transposase